MPFIVLAYGSMACVFLAYVAMVCTVMAYPVMAYIVMATACTRRPGASSPPPGSALA